MKKQILFSLVFILAFLPILLNAGNNVQVIIPNQDQSKKHFAFPKNLKAGEDYIANTVIFKMKPSYRQNCQKNSVNGILAIQDYANNIGTQNLEKIFPTNGVPAMERNSAGQQLVDLSLIYSFRYTANTPLELVINQMRALGYFEYVEPWYIPKTMAFVPNDANYSNAGQYFCKGNVAGSINSQDAWDLTQGNSSVVVGIVDTGTEPTHPDLSPNYDGGYDLAMNDADPTWQSNNHGCSVSGLACAATNNTIGVASAGFNCHFKAAKISDANGTLVSAYQGLVWAADNGCKIINCSWGGNTNSAYEQSLIDYAVINKNCVIFASAGNAGVEEPLYPASYYNVYRVAGSTSADARGSYSSYGLDVDFSAPGNSVFTTVNGTGYSALTGTSQACAIASGAAGIVQSYFNYTNGNQIGEKLKQTCDPYTGSSTLTLFNAGKLGKGRIDVYKALTQAAQSVVMNPITVTDNNDDIFMPSDVVDITGIFTSYLDPMTAACTASLTVVSVSSGSAPAVTDGSTFIGALGTLATMNSSSDRFQITISPTAPVNQVINLLITITDGAYSSKQYFSINANADYINVKANDVYTTITSKGRIGYNNDNKQLGLGFEYQLPSPKNLLHEMSLMIGTSSSKVSDMFKETGTTGNTDFTSSTRVYHVTSSPISDFDLDGKFTDASSASPLPIQVHHSSYAWNSAPNRKYVIVKYVLKNTGGGTLSNLYAGIMADWDITSFAQNKSSYDAGNKLGYCYDVNASGLYAGVKVLSNTAPANNYCIDVTAGGNGGIDATSDFLTAEKYTALSTSRNNDGYTSAGGDVMHCVSSGPYTLNSGDSVVVSFALIAGDNLADLQASAVAAQNKYNTQVVTCSSISANATAGPVTCFGGTNGSIGLTPMNGTAPYTFAWSNGSTVEDQLSLTAGTYSVVITDNLGCTATASSTVSQPSSALAATLDSVHNIPACGGTGAVFITATGGTGAYTYLWSPGNAITQDVTGLSPGTYSVTLTDQNGCTASTSANIVNGSGFSATIDSTKNIDCNGASTGGVFVTPIGGTPPYTYAWSNSSTTEDVTGISFGTYSVVVSDAPGCSFSLSTNLTQPAALTASATVTNEACVGNNNGSVDLSTAGGTSPYTYGWSPGGQTTQDISNLPGGDYSVTVTDVKGCTVAGTYSVSPAAPLVLVLDSTKNPTCGAGNNGGIYISMSGGSPSYSYSWSSGQTTQDISGLNAGSYSVTVTDSKGCTALTSSTLSAPSTLTVSIGTVVPAGCSFSNGSISVNASGGTPAYSYAWLPSGGTSSAATGLGIGNYSVTITDANGCSAFLTSALSDSCDFVWPGDANDDGIATNQDIIAIGIAYGSTGPVRSGATLNWIGQPCSDWADTLTGNINYKNVDCNGDGIINDDDTLAVVQNYGSVHNNKLISPVINSNTDIYAVVSTDSTGSGGTIVTVQIGLGTVAAPATNVYGVAYSVGFSDPSLVDLTSISFSGQNSWLGTQGTDLLSVGFPNGDAAVTRIDHVNASGNGIIHTMQFTTSDVLNGSGNSAALMINITNAAIVSANETLIPVNPVSDSLVVLDSALVTSIKGKIGSSGIVVYPNPSNGKFKVHSSQFKVGTANVSDVFGRKIYSGNFELGTLNLDLTHEPNGVYFLQIKTEAGIVSKKLIKE